MMLCALLRGGQKARATNRLIAIFIHFSLCMSIVRRVWSVYSVHFAFFSLLMMVLVKMRQFRMKFAICSERRRVDVCVFTFTKCDTSTELVFCVQAEQCIFHCELAFH